MDRGLRMRGSSPGPRALGVCGSNQPKAAFAKQAGAQGLGRRGGGRKVGLGGPSVHVTFRRHILGLVAAEGMDTRIYT